MREYTPTHQRANDDTAARELLHWASTQRHESQRATTRMRASYDTNASAGQHQHHRRTSLVRPYDDTSASEPLHDGVGPTSPVQTNSYPGAREASPTANAARHRRV